MKGLRDDRKQSLRIRRTLLGLTGYAVSWSVVAGAFVAGYVEVTVAQLAVAILVSVLINAIFLLLIATGVNRRLFRDPSMTFAQVLAGLAWMLWAIHVAPEVRGLMSLLIIPPFVFGVFRLGIGQQLLLAAIVSASYAAIVARHAWATDIVTDLRVGMLQWLVVTAMLLWFSFISGYVYRMRQRMRAYANELKEARDSLQTLVVRDELTGLYNRRHIMDVLERERGRADRHETTFAVVILDLDGFKQVNDSLGHLAGDELLRAVAREITRAIRSMDVAGFNGEFGRFGGEEFLLILPDTGIDGARRCAERIRERIHSSEFETSHGVQQVTLSGGVTCYRLGEPITETLHRSDQCLYRAKSDGRNRIVTDEMLAEA